MPVFMHDQAGYIRFFGVRRSGNHAVINFVLQNLDGPAVVLNQCDFGSDPFTTAKSFQYDGKIVSKGSHYEDDAEKVSAKEFQSRLVALSPHVRHVIAFHEETHVGSMSGTGRNPLLTGAYHGRAKNVVVYRSFLNWLASAYRHRQNYRPADVSPDGLALAQIQHFVNLVLKWKQHVALARGNDLAIGVHYDDWVDDEGTRASLLKSLGFAVKTLDLPEVSAFGRGSSFAPRRYDMAVIEGVRDRAGLQAGDPNFLNLIRICLMDGAFSKYLGEEFPVDLRLAHDILGTQTLVAGRIGPAQPDDIADADANCATQTATGRQDAAFSAGHLPSARD